MVKIKRHNQVFAIALLALFTAYYVDVSFFFHCHTVGGVTIVHSHIYGSNHAGTEATESEITLISALSSFQAFAAVLLFLAAIVFAIHEIILCKPSLGRMFTRLAGCVTLRAPPATY